MVARFPSFQHRYLTAAIVLVSCLSVLVGWLTSQSLLFFIIAISIGPAILIYLLLVQKPWLGILLIAAIAPFDDLQRLPGLPSVSIVKALGLVLLIAWLQKIYTTRKPVRITSEGTLYLLLLIILLFNSLTSNAVLESLSLWTTFLSYLLIYLVVINEFEDMEQVRTAMRLLVISAGLIGILAIVQFATGQTIFSTVLGYEELRAGNADAVRVVGTNSDANGGALAPVIGLPLAIGLLFTEKKKHWSLIYAVAIVLCSLHIILSFSRSAWVGIAAGLLLLFTFGGYRRFLRVSLVVLSAAIVVMLLPFDLPIDAITSRAENIVNISPVQEYQRVTLFRATSDIIRDNLLTGVGLGYSNFAEMIVNYTGFAIAPHSSVLSLVSAGGLIAYAIYLLFFVTLLIQAFSAFQRATTEKQYILLALMSSILAWQVRATLNPGYVWIVGWLVAALLAAATENAKMAYER